MQGSQKKQPVVYPHYLQWAAKNCKPSLAHPTIFSSPLALTKSVGVYPFVCLLDGEHKSFWVFLVQTFCFLLGARFQSPFCNLRRWKHPALFSLNFKEEVGMRLMLYNPAPGQQLSARLTNIPHMGASWWSKIKAQRSLVFGHSRLCHSMSLNKK